MSIEEIKSLDFEGLETRSVEIRESMSAEDADLEALGAEVTALEERKAVLIEERNKAQAAVLAGAGTVIDKEETKMEVDVRSTQEYINAYAEYIKTGEDKEVRSLLTDNVTQSGTAGVPVPTYVEERIRTAWDKNTILSKVKRSEFKGNVKIGFEMSSTGAAVHTEGESAPSEETLALGIVTLVPQTLKKWITISDEVLDASGEAFLDYVMDEIEQKIIELACDTVVSDIVGSPSTATTTAPAVATVAASGVADIVNAISLLSDEASNPVIIMNKASYAYYKGLAMAAGYGIDIFDGLEVIFNNTLDSATATPSSGVTNHIVIVGDLNGYQANFPKGYEPTIKVDDLSLAENDLVKVVGRLPMGHGVVASGHFAVVTKTGA